jgi:ribonuclease III
MYKEGPLLQVPSLNNLITVEKVESILNGIQPIGDNGTRLRIKSLQPYQKAFVHKSFIAMPDPSVNFLPKDSNERSEFLGDKFLGAVVAYYLYQRYPDNQEGFLTKVLSRIVRSSMLHRLARFLKLGDYILLSPLMESLTFVSPKKGRNSPWLYEDVFESFCGAIIEDFGDEEGYRYVKRFIINVIEHEIDFSELIFANENHKDTLQRYFQRKRWPTPVYEDLYIGGHVHSRSFTAGVFITSSQLSELDNDVQKSVKSYHETHVRTMNEATRNAIVDYAKSHDAFLLGLDTACKKLDAQQSAAKRGLGNLNIDTNWT